MPVQQRIMACCPVFHLLHRVEVPYYKGIHVNDAHWSEEMLRARNETLFIISTIYSFKPRSCNNALTTGTIGISKISMNSIIFVPGLRNYGFSRTALFTNFKNTPVYLKKAGLY